MRPFSWVPLAALTDADRVSEAWRQPGTPPLISHCFCLTCAGRRGTCQETEATVPLTPISWATHAPPHGKRGTRAPHPHGLTPPRACQTGQSLGTPALSRALTGSQTPGNRARHHFHLSWPVSFNKPNASSWFSSLRLRGAEQHMALLARGASSSDTPTVYSAQRKSSRTKGIPSTAGLAYLSFAYQGHPRCVALTQQNPLRDSSFHSTPWTPARAERTF